MQAIFSIGKELFGGSRERGLRIQIHTERVVRYPCLLYTSLSARYGRTISVEVFADLFDITDEAWRNAIEGRLGRIKYGLVVEPRYALDAANIFRGMKKREYETVDLINTAAIQRDEPQAMDETLYDAVKTDIPYVDFCLKRYLGPVSYTHLQY